MYRSHRSIHFTAFRAEYFTLIHSDLENYDSALEKALLFLCMDYGYRLKLRSEQKGWSFVRRLTDLTMIATDEEGLSSNCSLALGLMTVTLSGQLHSLYKWPTKPMAG